MAKISQKNVKENQRTSSFPWEDSVYSSTLSAFTKEGSLDKVFLKMEEPFFWGSTIPVEDDIICNEYGGDTIPFYVFITLGVHLPFTAFEVDVFNHLMVAHSQLHPSS